MGRTTFLPVALILLAGLWHLATIRTGQDWGDDFALYISHARNISEGADYADTGWIYNPANPQYSPRTYPPVYPLLLAPVYRLFGMNFEAMKAQQVVFLMLLMAVVYLATRREMPPAYALAVALLLGLSPFLWMYKDRVMTEILFMLFCCLALHLLNIEADRPPWRRLARAALAGLVIYLACGTRAVGVVLVPCAVLADMVSGPGWQGVRRWRWPGLASATVLLVFAGCVLVQRALLVLEGSYLNLLAAGSFAPVRNLVSMARGADEVLGSGAQLPLRLALLLPLGGVVLSGYVRCLRRQVTARECFPPLYLATILLWPPGRPEGATPRYLLPLLPFVFIYLGHGVLGLAQLAGRTWGRRLAAGVGVTVLAAWVALYTRVDFGPMRHGIGRPETQALFQHIREQTPPQAVVLFSKPRALALFTGRRSSPAQEPPATDRELWDHLRRIRATHFVVSQPFPETDGLLRDFADRNADRLERVFHNRHFTIYRVADSAHARADAAKIE
jgi:4-amino-4-deoxy-L-arabinose transferase-like glycosyltransferase